MTSSQLRAVVIEDEPIARRYLVELLHGCDVEVVGAVASADEAQSALDGGLNIDVAFVDIQLGGQADAGIELVRDASQKPGAPAFVFATAHDQHAIAAFEHGVVDYLMKPFNEERVQRCLERVRRVHPPDARPRSPTRLVARSARGLVFLEREQVLAFQAAERLTFVHVATGRHDINLSLASLEGLTSWNLMRVHRNWLVQLANVRELVKDGGEVKLFVGPQGAERREGEGVWIPIARDRVARVRDALVEGTAGLRSAPRPR